ncbi:MAG: hypothetical protein ABI795_03655 [Chthoniobacterales bacterium]
MLRFRSGRAGWRTWLLIFCSIAVLGGWAEAGEGKGTKRKNKPKETGDSPSPAAENLSTVPLPIGQEAKGVVLPDFDADGHLRGRFVAGTAKRIDNQNMQLRALKMLTFTPENSPDLEVEMSDSMLNLQTRLLKSQQRTTVRRSDFTIAGDAAEFDTVQRKGTMVGNVKMVITNVAHLAGKEGQ